jgi:hypothetical protein
MKKLVFMFVAVAAISFASCGGQQAQPAPEVEADSVEVVDSVEADTVQADSVAAPADSAKAM